MTAPARSADGRFDHALLLIGRLNYSWTNTESLFVHLIAGLVPTDKETAVVLFLTLNTMRARVDLVERLAKLERTPEDRRRRILAATRQLVRLSAERNRYNHSIYSFDMETGDVRTIMMRIADRKDGIRMGRSDALDDQALARIETVIADLTRLNKEIWAMIFEFGYPA